MAQFEDFLHIPTEQIDNSGYANLFQNIMKGYQMAAQPKAMKDERMIKEFQSQLMKNELENAPEKNRLNNEYLKARTQALNSPSSTDYSKMLSGDAANAFAIQSLEATLGPNDPRVIEAKKAAAANQDYRKGLTDYRNMMSETADKRAATSLGKKEMELQEVQNGFMPGSNGKLKLTPEQQSDLINRYELDIQKSTTDVATRNRALFAKNIEITNSMINPESLLRYSGPKGRLSRIAEEAKAANGTPSKEYSEYLKSVTAGSMQAQQMRQFYGTSIQPEQIKELESLSNPETWKESPETAAVRLETIRKILGAETGTYQQALTSPAPYKAASSSERMFRGPDGNTYTESEMKKATGMK